jgi:hypothetical protein
MTLALVALQGTLAQPRHAAATPTPAQVATQHAEAPHLLDSTTALAAALAAQREFERVRLQFMLFGSAGSGSCNEIIGRFCYTFGDRSGKSLPPPTEMESVKRARAALIHTLDSLVSISAPGDWLTATLVRYRLEAGEGEIALRQLRDCQATTWWCSALRGMLHHAAARHELAQSSFDEARLLMDLYTRCEWDNIGWLLSTQAAREYDELLCEDQLRVAHTAWWLAQPLYSQRGNHRRSEHDVRRVMQRLSQTGMNPTWLRWGDDMSEIVVRFGWPDYWRRYWNPMNDPAGSSPRISQFTMEPSYHFIPDWRALLEPWSATEADWNLLPQDSREEYGPDSMVFGSMASQSARFLRGDSLLVLSRVSVANDSVLSTAQASDAGIALSAGPDEEPLLFFAPASPPEFTLRAKVANRNWMASVEMFNGSGHAARVRFAAPAITRDANGLAISDIMVFSGDTPDDPSAESLLAEMLPALALQKGGNIGIYWETYGLSREDVVEVEVGAIPDRRGFFDRIGQALRLVERSGSMAVRWTEGGSPSRSLVARVVQLNLSNLRDGWYTLRLSVRVNGGVPLTAIRRMEIKG